MATYILKCISPLRNINNSPTDILTHLHRGVTILNIENDNGGFSEFIDQGVKLHKLPDRIFAFIFGSPKLPSGTDENDAMLFGSLPTIPTPVETAAIGWDMAVEGPAMGWAMAVEVPAIGWAESVERPVIGWAVIEAIKWTKLSIAAIFLRISAICCCVSALLVVTTSQCGTSPSDETVSSYEM